MALLFWNHPCPFPAYLNLPHSIWILSPKFILKPFPSLHHLHWQTASTAVQTTITSYLDILAASCLPTSDLAPSSPVCSAYCCEDNHSWNCFTSLLNHFSGSPDFLLWCMCSGPCLVLPLHFMSVSPHLLCCSDTGCVLLSFNIPNSFSGTWHFLFERPTPFGPLIGS